MTDNKVSDVKTEFSIEPKVERDIKNLIQYAQEKQVVQVSDMVEASSYVKSIDELKKTVEDQRTQFTKPLNESLKRINDFFKKFSQPLAAADTQIREKLVDCQKTLPADSGNTFGEIHFTTNIKITVQALSQVPVQFLKVDEVAVRKAVLAGETEIAGILIETEKRVSL